MLGDGSNTYFWFDRWVGDVPFCTRFARLFDLTMNKLSTVVDMCALGWEDGGDAWSWRRRLWAWEEEMVEECMHFFLLSKERDRHRETTPTSQLGWHPGKLLSYAHQTLDLIKKGKKYVQRKRGD